MADNNKIQAKEWSHNLGLIVVIYATIATILSAKFQVNLMTYTTPIIIGFCGMTVTFACTKRFFYKVLLQNNNLLFFDKQENAISTTFTMNESQSIESELQNEIESESPKANDDTQEVRNDTKNDTPNSTDKVIEHSDSYLDKYAMLQEDIEKENTKRKILVMEAVREYVTYTIAPYLKKEDVLILLENINCMAVGQTNSYKGIRSDLNNPLRSPDLRHLAWNIGERLGISNRDRAIFIKASFPFELRDATVEYLERNLRDVIPASIPIDKPAKGDYKFNLMKKTMAA